MKMHSLTRLSGWLRSATDPGSAKNDIAQHLTDCVVTASDGKRVDREVLAQAWNAWNHLAKNCTTKNVDPTTFEWYVCRALPAHKKSMNALFKTWREKGTTS